MTRQRMYGSDVPFCAWMRACSDLPSNSPTCGFVAADVDLVIHRYKTVIDNIGHRFIQSLMHIEIKTRGGNPTSSQIDTLMKQHYSIKRNNRIGNDYIRNFGVSFLFMSGETPDDSEWMDWGGRFKDKRIVRKRITRDQLISLMKFDLHPDNLGSDVFRRHHATEEIIESEITELGFECDTIRIKRS